MWRQGPGIWAEPSLVIILNRNGVMPYCNTHRGVNLEWKELDLTDYAQVTPRYVSRLRSGGGFTAAAPGEISHPQSTHMLCVWHNIESSKYFLLDWPSDQIFLHQHKPKSVLALPVSSCLNGWIPVRMLCTVRFCCRVLQHWQHRSSAAGVSDGICAGALFARSQLYWPSEYNINQPILFCFHSQLFGRVCISPQSICSRALWCALMLLMC